MRSSREEWNHWLEYAIIKISKEENHGKII